MCVALILLCFLGVNNMNSARLYLNILSASILAIGFLSSAQAAAIHDASLFTTNTLAANDDGSTGLVNIGFNANFFGTTYDSLYVNNNGNVTFTGALRTFTPFSLLSTSIPMLAPFFADVDTRGAGSGLVQYGTGSLGGFNVFGVNWINVGYFNSHTDKLNSFQLIITDRSDTGLGNFDFQFNYDKILWETGDASGGSGGLGGNCARAGWSNGVSNSYEISGSAACRAFLDANSQTGLINGSLDSNVDGQYNFSVRNGQVVSNVPEPTSMALVGLGLLGLGAARRRRVY